MDLASTDGSEARFAAYIEGLLRVIGHPDRVGPLRDFCLGLIMPGERKSVEPMAAVTAPDRTAAQHQSLRHFVGQSPWSNEKVLAKVRKMVLPAIARRGPIEAWIIPFGELRRPRCARDKESTRPAWRASTAGSSGSGCRCRVPIATRVCRWPGVSIYRKNGRPAMNIEARQASDEIDFETKPEIALEQIKGACNAGLPRGVVPMDAGYGCNTDLRTGIGALALTYVAGILQKTPRCGRPARDRCRRRNGLAAAPGRSAFVATTSIDRSRSKSSLGLPKRSWRMIEWREGTAAHQSLRFARLLVRVVHRDNIRTESWPEEWLLIGWPKGEEKPAKYWLSTGPKNIAFRKLADLTKLRCRIERDYQELKQEVGLEHFEGRGWRGSHGELVEPPPPRDPVHRGLWIPGLRKEDDSPLGASFRPSAQEICRSQRLPTRRRPR